MKNCDLLGFIYGWSVIATLGQITTSSLGFMVVITIVTGWWFGNFLLFPYIGTNHPNWLIFFRGVETTNQGRLCNKPTYNSGPHIVEVGLKIWSWGFKPQSQVKLRHGMVWLPPDITNHTIAKKCVLMGVNMSSPSFIGNRTYLCNSGLW